MKDVLWKADLDNKYQCSVKQTDEFYGVLTIKEGAKVLLERQVSMTYSPVFGPDVSDIAEWESQAIEFIDNGK
jgi:hypothetical protein